MNYGVIKDKQCINIIVLDGNDTLEQGKIDLIPMVCDDIVPCIEGYWIGDYYNNGIWEKYNPDLSPAEKRKLAYSIELIIRWEDGLLTVDEANKLYFDYFAEGSEKANQLQVLIISAKEDIRLRYPDIV